MTEYRHPPEVHGHRGCRGLYPENTLPAFFRAAELGCDRVELDVVISGDGQVIVSHEPWLEHRICRNAHGDSIPEADERSYNLYRMTVKEIQQCDCGKNGHPDFPEQKTMRAVKPTLRQVVEGLEEHVTIHGLRAPGYNIEIKSEPGLYGSYQPMPDEFVRLVLETLDSLGIEEECILQSFDPAILEALHRMAPDIPLSLLVEDADGLEADLARLSFLPQVYSPHYQLVDTTVVNAVHALGMDIAVWTVNENDDIERMMEMGVDAVITDHPERMLRMLGED